MPSLKQKLNPQAQIILDILEDGDWHCPIDWKYSDGHGKRLTDINRYLKEYGKELKWEWCNCGRHTATIKKRRIEPITQNIIPPPRVATWLAQFKTPAHPLENKQQSLL